jgi:beta-galactosidase
MKIYFAIINTFLLLSLCQLTFSQAREIIDLDKEWKFIQKDIPEAYETGYTEEGWEVVDLPHDWSIEYDFSADIPFGHRIGYVPTGIGWYRKSFELKENDLKKNIEIEFDGIYMNSDVWINGHFLGHYPYGYLPVNYVLSPYLKKGDNVISVKVDNSLQPNSRWYTGSGIYRHVRLILCDPVHFEKEHVFITTPEVTEEHARIRIDARIGNSDLKSSKGIYTVILKDRNGKELKRSSVEYQVDAEASTSISREIHLNEPKLWSVSSPELYTVHLQLTGKNKLLDDLSIKTGIRKIEFHADKGFFLNGKSIKMKGVNLHHAGGCVGAAVPDIVWHRRLKLLKDMGCNAIRTAHNPPSTEFLNMCDSMGFLVMNEAFDEWLEVKGHGDNVVTWGYHKYFDEWSERDLRKFIRRDRNHPSVVIWSVGNEVKEQGTEDGHLILQKLVDICHEEDPTRPVTQGCSMIAAEGMAPATMDFLNKLDIVGYNYVDRWRNRRELYFSPDKHENPEWKMIGTENSTLRYIRGEYSLGDDKERVEANYYSNIIDNAERWKFIETRDYVMGDFLWTGIDYLGESHWPHINHNFGVIDRCGFPKDSYYFLQSIWTDEPMIHLLPHWNWSDREGQFIPVIAFTNCESVELFINGRSVGEKRIDFPRVGMIDRYNNYLKPRNFATTANLHLTWDVPYEPGTLKAVGKIKGNKVFEKVLSTTGKPYALKLSVDNDTVKNKPLNIAHVKVEVIDAAGRIVPTANDLLHFAIEGPGKFLGIDNGDPGDHNHFGNTERKVFNGLCLAIVEASDKPGTITISVRSEGLKGDMIEIKNLTQK